MPDPRVGQSVCSKPRLLDLFCGAGGCSVGYYRAGFEVVGVDIVPQPNYPFEFYQADALGFDFDPGWFHAVHASPPCQAYSSLRGFTTTEYPQLIEYVRELLIQTGLPYVIENVVGAPLINPIRLCGSSFGLKVWRHRLFETSFQIPLLPPCSHSEHPKPLDVTGTGWSFYEAAHEAWGRSESQAEESRGRLLGDGDRLDVPVGAQSGDPAGVHRTPRPLPHGRDQREGGGMSMGQGGARLKGWRLAGTDRWWPAMLGEPPFFDRWDWQPIYHTSRGRSA